jgi:putative tryptophan/tyrosine transport system substrate-binding protein
MNPNSPIAEDNWKNMEAAADILRQKVIVLEASSESSLDAAFAGLIEHRADALIVDIDPVFFSRREQIVTLAARRVATG